MNNDPTGFKAYFPWIHYQDWSYPAPNHSRGLLDALGTTINIVSYRIHTHVYFHRPAPPVDPNEIYPENTPDKVWGEQKIHPADEIYIPGVKLQSDYFKQTEKDDPEHSHFTLWVTRSDIAININTSGSQVFVPKGTPICLNARKTSIGVQRGKVKQTQFMTISYPRIWIHPASRYRHLEKNIWERWIKNGTLQDLPAVAGMPKTMNYPPDLD